MAYAEARAQLVTLLEAATLSYQEHGLVGALRHEKQAADDRLPAPRTFWLRFLTVAVVGPRNRGDTRRRLFEVELTVRYPDLSNAAALDEAIASDFEDVSDALLTVGNWGRPSSTINLIATTGDATMLPAEVEDIDGGRLLRIRFPMETRYA